MYSGPADMRRNKGTWLDTASLNASDIIPEHRRADFIEQVFWNIHDVIAINTRLRDALNKRPKSYTVIGGIVDIFRDSVPFFAPIVSYGEHQLYGKYDFEKEKCSNVEVRLHLPNDHPRFERCEGFPFRNRSGGRILVNWYLTPI